MHTASHHSAWIDSVACRVRGESHSRLLRFLPRNAREKSGATFSGGAGHSARFRAGRGSRERTCSRVYVATRLEVRRWLALRASVLRRAVSQLARPLLHLSAASAMPGRSNQAAHTTSPHEPLSLSGALALPPRAIGVSWACGAQPNHSLNRTHCGVPPFGLENPSPYAATPQRSG